MLVACGGVEPPVISHTRYRSNFVRFACKERAVILQAAYNMGSLGGQASALSIGIWAPLRPYAALRASAHCGRSLRGLAACSSLTPFSHSTSCPSAYQLTQYVQFSGSRLPLVYALRTLTS